MTMTRLLLAIAIVVALAGEALAQTYPSRPVSLIVPYPPGGPTDALARIVSERMRAALRQPVIIENVGGAAGTIGINRVARAAPDGYTLSFGNVASHVFSSVVYRLQYDILKDLEPVGLLTIAPMWIVATNTLPANNVRELIDWMKVNPDKATAGIVGAGSPAHLCGVYFQNNTGTRFQFVPYRGAGPVMQDLIGGQIDLACVEASNTRQHVQSGRIKAYAVMTKSRWAAAPDVPTIDEAGVPGLYLPFWHGLWAARNTPKDALAKLNAATVETLADPAVRQRLTDLGQELPPREQQTPEALAAYHKAEIAKWEPIITAANIKPE